MRSFKILDTSLQNIDDDHFKCVLKLRAETVIFGEVFRCTSFDGLKVKMINDNNYIIGELHG